LAAFCSARAGAPSREQVAAADIERDDLVERAGRVPVGERLADGVGVLADELSSA
jgi:hypothetical protein